MKKIISPLCALFASAAFGATTVPVQLLNPTGSTSGQAVVSNGPSSSPTWQNVAVANVSGAAPLASPTFTGTVTAANLTATGNITPSQTAGIVGTTTNNNVNAGSVGEFISANVASGSAVALTSNTVANVTTITLTPGDWEVRGSVAFNPGGTTAITALGGWITTTSATNPGAPNGGALAFFNGLGGTAGQNGNAFPVGTIRLSVSVTTTVYLCAFSIFSTSTNAAYGFIGARRVR